MNRNQGPASFSEAMQVLGVSKVSLRKALNDGRVRGVRIGKSWKIAWNSLEEVSGRAIDPREVRAAATSDAP